MELSPDHLDALTEIINIGVGRAAAVLNEMTNSHVRLNVPFIKVLLPSEIEKEGDGLWDQDVSSVRMSFSGSLTGVAALVFPPKSALKLVALLTGEGYLSPDLDSLKMETLNEVGNIVINGVLGSIGNMLEKHINYSIPSYSEDTLEGLVSKQFYDSGTIIMAQADFFVETENIQGNILLIFEVNSFDAILIAL